MWKICCFAGFFLIACAVFAQTDKEYEFPLQKADPLSHEEGTAVLADSTGQLDSLLNTPINSVSKSWQNIRLAPASVTIVTDKDIRKFGYRTLADVLNSQRGFYTSYDRNYMYAGVRGFSRPTDYNNRLLVLLNGHYMNENVFGSAPVGYDLPLNMDAIERIEIVRGPGSVVYGTGAMFAVINIITQDGGQLDEVSASVEAGSFGYGQAQFAAGRNFEYGPDLAVMAVVGRRDGTDLYFSEYDTDSTEYGIAHNLDGEQYYSVSGRASLGNLSLQGYYSFRQKSIPTASFSTVFNHSDAETRDSYGLVEAQYEYEAAGNLRLLLRANYNVYDYTGRYFYPEENPDSSTNKWIGAEAQMCWDAIEYNRLILGVEYQDNLRADYRSYSGTELLFSRDVPFSIVSAYVQDEFQVQDNFNITAGLRISDHSATGVIVSPRLAAIYNPYHKTALKFLYGTAFRSPNFSELYLMFPGDSKDNPRLQPEKISTLEVAAEQQIGSSIYTVASLYYNHITNLIEQERDADSLLQFQNSKAIRALGAEIEVNARSQLLRVYASYALQSSIEEQTDRQISNSPAHLLKAGVCVNFAETLSVAVDGAYESSRRTVYNEETGAFAIAGLNFVWQPANPVELSLKVYNLFNTAYSLPGGFEHRQRSIDQDGRSIVARVRLAL